MGNELDINLQKRYDQVDEWHQQQLGYATSLYVNDNITSDEYNSIADRMKTHYQGLKDASLAMYNRIKIENN